MAVDRLWLLAQPVPELPGVVFGCRRALPFFQHHGREARSSVEDRVMFDDA